MHTAAPVSLSLSLSIYVHFYCHFSFWFQLLEIFHIQHTHPLLFIFYIS